MNPDMSLKPPAEGYILSPLALARRTKKLQAAFAANPACKLGDLKKKVIHSFLQHYLAIKLPKAKIAQLMNDRFNTTFTVGAVIGFVDRRGLVVYNESHTPESTARNAARIKAKAERKDVLLAKSIKDAGERAALEVAREQRRAERLTARVFVKPTPSKEPLPTLTTEERELLEAPVAFLGRRIPLLLAGNRECRQITGIGKKDGKVLCCGQSTGSLKESYCPTHKLVNFQPVSARRRQAYVPERVSKHVYFEGFAV